MTKLPNQGPSPLTKSTKFSEIDSILQTLKNNQTYSIADIVATIKQIDNLKKNTLDAIETSAPYDNQTANLENVDDLYVDMTYQRRMRLQKLLNKLKETSKFDKDSAGFVDIAQRTDGTLVVWDGFRRIIMAALTGLESVPASKTRHLPHDTLQQQVKKEARLFKIRNTPEKMTPEETFKAEVVYEDPKAMRVLSLLKDCKLDVEGVNPAGVSLGGISEFCNNFEGWRQNPEEYKGNRQHWIDASLMIQTIYPKHTKVSTYLLRDLAWVLTVNEESDKSYDLSEILQLWSKWIMNTGYIKQSDVTSAGHKKKTITSWWIAKNILKDNNGLVETLEENLPEIIKTYGEDVTSVTVKGIDEDDK